MNNIYYILAGLAVIYILISLNNKRISKRRKSRKFMEGYQSRLKNRKESDKPKEGEDQS